MDIFYSWRGLGFQLCKYGYDNLTEMQAAVDRTEAAGIPHDGKLIACIYNISAK